MLRSSKKPGLFRVLFFRVCFRVFRPFRVFRVCFRVFRAFRVSRLFGLRVLGLKGLGDSGASLLLYMS